MGLFAHPSAVAASTLLTSLLLTLSPERRGLWKRTWKGSEEQTILLQQVACRTRPE